MVVIAARAEEQRAAIGAGQIKPQILGIELPRRLQRAGLQMHMADHAALGRTTPRRLRTRRQRLQIQRLRVHGNLRPLPAPAGAGAVRIDLDAIAFGIGEIHRLAHQMIGSALPVNAAFRHMPQPCRQIVPRGQQKGDVKQPRFPAGGAAGGGIGAQLDQHPVAHAQTDMAGIARHGVQPQNLLIKRAHGGKVAHGQRHATDFDGGIAAGHGRSPCGCDGSAPSLQIWRL